MSDLMREQFEAAFVAEYVADLASKAKFDDGVAEAIVRATALERDDAGEYKAVVPRERFKGWVQGRASFVVELPDPYEGAKRYMNPESAFAHKEGIDECRDAIRAAGVKTK